MAGYVRFVFAIMLCIANMIIYGLKVNISTTIIGMVKTKIVNNNDSSSHECPAFDNITSTSGGGGLEGTYEWSTTEQGLVVSLYFAGYMLGMFPAGYFADRFNTKWVLLISVFCNAIFTLMVPWAADAIGVLLFLRFMTGLVSAVNLPVVNVLVGKWVVYEEKSTWVGIIYAGTSIGTVLSILSSGFIMNGFGWRTVFYVHGIIPLIWCICFALFFADCPEQQKLISENERQLIVKSFGHRQPNSSKRKIPWKHIFTSKPMWALIATNTFGNFCWYFMLTQLPLYMNKMLRFNIKSNAVISCSPYLINAVTNPLLGKLLDWGRNQGFWTQTSGRKIAVGVSCIPPSILMIAIAYMGCERLWTTIMLVCSIVLGGAIFVGHLINQNDLAPNYAGILMGLTNFPGTISAFVLPALVGALTENGHTFHNWRYIFWICVIAQMTAFAIFTIWGTAKIQKWNYPEGSPEREQADAVDETETRMI
ncbi:hypothetical protein HCN44_010451 [Aphidius gifuensis]|uniref:Major facilitator superfamily (MFS) profile domain-containing protein n=1 Tax=Aphidius gifuensis TaxID=684658 RepID=A0A834XQM4_APHGI|nr:sialin-like [Aphidius gifuensis]XP_044012905.1 sialin-like [Aphidius gifuensis]XP_044012906.1 sialin-like [Aphidius gifuensis]XP_044012907.1 sialin-like [Aphidius gifuensis]KAF7991650.1 hypothetical protein HCN44_010451 [Aphidius gifuensis]